MYDIILNTITEEKRGAILDQGQVVEWFVESPQMQAKVGDIYKGRVTKVLPGMEAAFVNLAIGKDGYLHINDVKASNRKQSQEDKAETYTISECITEGQEVLVQVMKEEMSTKGPRLSEYIQLPGQTIVYLPFSDYVAVSKRLGDEDLRKEWRAFGQETVRRPEGIIIRTAARELQMKQVEQELNVLRELFQESLQKGKSKSAPALIFEEGSMLHQIARNYSHHPETKIVTDNHEDYLFLKRWMKMNELNQAQLVMHTDKEGIFSTYHLEKKLERVFNRKVWLKNGGHLVIDETEAMTVIDVNTGKFTGKTTLEDTVVKANREAAVAVAEQLRLRDIGGIILIDFIDMEKEESKREVLTALKQAVVKDRTRTNVIGFTQLGLVEMTRKKSRSTVANRLLETCSACDGQGSVKSGQAQYFALEREFLESDDNVEAAMVDVSEALARYLEGGSYVKQLERATGLTVFYREVSGLAREGFAVRLLAGKKDVEAFYKRATESS